MVPRYPEHGSLYLMGSVHYLGVVPARCQIHQACMFWGVLSLGLVTRHYIIPAIDQHYPLRTLATILGIYHALSPFQYLLYAYGHAGEFRGAAENPNVPGKLYVENQV